MVRFMTKARTNILDPVWKQLFARSGNMCAGPDCSTPLFDKEGIRDVFIAHIRGVSPKGPRHDTEMKDHVNDAENLLLLCNRHHSMIDTMPVTEWTVAAVAQLKRDHERQVEAMTGRLLSRVTDNAYSTQHTAPETLDAWNTHIYGPDLDDADDVNRLAGITRAFIEAVQRLPQGARELYAIIIDHAHEERAGLARRVLNISLANLTTRVKAPDLADLLRVIEEAGLGSYEPDDEPPSYRADFAEDRDFDIVTRLKGFCADAGVTVDALLVEGRWNLLQTGSSAIRGE